MRYLHRSGLPAGFSFSPILERAGASICCPDCQSDQIRRSKTRGSVESLLAFLRMRPYRCEECNYRFFRWSIRTKPKATKPARTTNARDCELLTPREASHGGNAPQADMGCRPACSRLGLLRMRMGVQCLGAPRRPLAQ